VGSRIEVVKGKERGQVKELSRLMERRRRRKSGFVKNEGRREQP